jgi:hypothetical protein
MGGSHCPRLRAVPGQPRPFSLVNCDQALGDTC